MIMISSSSFNCYQKQPSSTTATMKVVNDITEALDFKQHCASIFTVLSKAFGTVNHAVMLQRLLNIGLSSETVVKMYLRPKSMCTL